MRALGPRWAFWETTGPGLMIAPIRRPDTRHRRTAASVVDAPAAYSLLSAELGSARAARTAGMALAPTATASRTATTTPYVTGSRGDC